MKPKFLIPFLVIYCLFLGFEVYAEHINTVYQQFGLLSMMQPSLLPLLIIYLIYNAKGQFSGFTIWVLVGLIFDWLSDIVLTIYKDAFNIPSVMGYFAGHICYTIAFGWSIKKSGYKVSLLNRFIFSLPPIFYIINYYLFIYHYMSNHMVQNSYIIPISLYALSILAMSTSALWRMGTTTDASYWCITSGALFYMLSDSITGYNYFVEPITYKYLISMTAYGLALLLFVIGAIIHKPQIRVGAYG